MTDADFPSGAWTGFFLQRMLPGRHQTDMRLTFENGRMRGRGRDWVGEFTVDGEYDPVDSTCRWTKHYLGKHDVAYRGVNEGQGIWGAWEISAFFGLLRDRGVFHIWPVGMTPTEEADRTERAMLEEVPPGPSPAGVVLFGVLLLLGVALLVWLVAGEVNWGW
jgi:hypothetical protein